MVNDFEKNVVRSLKNALLFIGSRRSLPMLKGTLAYILAYVFIFLRGFDELSEFPQAFYSIMIVVIVIQPGTSVGACIQSTVLAVLGVSLGCVGFMALAKLSPWPVAQAFAFALILYAMALVRAQGLRWFNFSLLCILNSFNGIFTSYTVGNAFSPKLLVAYYIAYLWAAAIALGVNILVLPYSSEKELRQMLVTSLEHVATFAHLLAKEYSLEITEEERTLRNHLNATIRADFGLLSQKIEETAFEINYTRFSMKSYRIFVSKTRAIQQALITAHSNLVGVEEDGHAIFKESFLPATAVSFANLRRTVDLTIRSIGRELRCKPMVISATQTLYSNYMSMESQPQTLSDELDNQLAKISERLAADADVRAELHPHPGVSRRSSEGTPTPSTITPATITPATITRKTFRPEIECGTERLRKEFDIYAVTQHKLLQEALVSGRLAGATDGHLRVHQPRASLRDTYSCIRGHFEGDALPMLKVRRRPAEISEKDIGEGEDILKTGEFVEDAGTVVGSGHSLIRVWGFLFALDQFVSELEALSHAIRPEGIQQRMRLRVHLFEALRRPDRKTRGQEDDDRLPLPEALALLEKKPYIPATPTIWQRLDHCVKMLQGPTSLFAAKNAAATSIYAILIYATAPRPWFINYVLSPGIMTVVIALEPTLGQSMVSFVLQIVGSGIGYLWGLAVLEMFRNVGGYTFNPYGIICMVIPFALIMQYMFYNKPNYFVLALLAMNALGVVVSVEWVAVEYLHLPEFDTPAYMTAKALTALAVSVAIAALFQLLILRNPARRTLRKRVADLTFETLSYTVLLQAFGKSLISLESEDRPAKSVLMRVERELRLRELTLQSDIISLMPLLSFASAEPQFAKPFRKDIFQSFIQSNQLVLDRLRETRAALGTHYFENFILSDFASVLAPYRTRHRRAIKTQLYMTASSLRSKAPLPHDTPLRMLTDTDRADFIHDILVLSSQFARKVEEGGDDLARSREFVRYVAYLLGWTTLWEPIRTMEDASKELLGELESKLL